MEKKQLTDEEMLKRYDDMMIELETAYIEVKEMLAKEPKDDPREVYLDFGPAMLKMFDLIKRVAKARWVFAERKEGRETADGEGNGDGT